jgi:hypothetical protein
LGRFEFLWLPAASVSLEAGRLRFRDPLGIIAEGLFDGLGGSVVAGKARISAGAFYTGLLYKESVKIIMNSADAEKYVAPFSYDDADSYFASRRVLVSAAGEFTDLTPRTTLTVNALAQFDLNPEAFAGKSSLHTQYLSARYAFLPLESLTLTASAVAGLAESQEAAQAQFAAVFSADWEVPGALQDLLLMEFRWASGAMNDSITAFTPITSIAQGQVFTPNLSGLMTVKGKYTARFHRSFSASAEGTCFMRTDEETLIGPEFPSSSSLLLGGEVYGAVLWAPVSDFMVTAGGGAFFSLNAPVRWKVLTGIVFLL